MNWQSKKIFFLLIITIIFIGNACRKVTKYTAPDISSPVIKISTPVKNGLQNSINPISIVGTALDNDLASLDVNVFNITDTIKLYSDSKVISGTGVTIQQNFSKFVTKPTSCLLEVVVKDKAGNRSADSTYFNIY